MRGSGTEWRARAGSSWEASDSALWLRQPQWCAGGEQRRVLWEASGPLAVGEGAVCPLTVIDIDRD